MKNKIGVSIAEVYIRGRFRAAREHQGAYVVDDAGANAISPGGHQHVRRIGPGHGDGSGQPSHRVSGVTPAGVGLMLELSKPDKLTDGAGVGVAVGVDTFANRPRKDFLWATKAIPRCSSILGISQAAQSSNAMA